MMNKDLEELMQIRVISENNILSNMIKDIVPLKENRFTDLEIDASKNQEFSLVIYKKENLLVRLIKGIKLSLEKLRIMKHSNEFSLEKIKNK